ncbi:MAG TPA: hypothetical protein VFK02_11400 [Kofleriaceae bacterium]|nr:hypothetical protein [Kofleriaceae bacterium]
MTEDLMYELLNPEFNSTVNQRLDGMVEAFYGSAPAVRQLATSPTIDKQLFVRHTIETILRIRLARIADSKVILHFARTNPFAAQKWCTYTEQAMLRDRLFLRELRNLGVSDESVSGADTSLATKLLQGYLYYTIEHEGPCALLSKSYFVEYILRKTQQLWNGHVTRMLDEPSLKGVEVHLLPEDDEDRSAFVWNVLMATVRSAEDETRVLYHLDACYGLFVACFNELASNGNVSPPPQDPAGAAVTGAHQAAQLGTKPDDAP